MLPSLSPTAWLCCRPMQRRGAGRPVKRLLGGTVDAIVWRAVSGRNNRGHFADARVHDVYIKGALLPQVYSGFLHGGDSRSQVNAIIFPLSITSLSFKWCTDQHSQPAPSYRIND